MAPTLSHFWNRGCALDGSFVKEAFQDKTEGGKLRKGGDKLLKSLARKTLGAARSAGPKAGGRDGGSRSICNDPRKPAGGRRHAAPPSPPHGCVNGVPAS